MGDISKPATLKSTEALNTTFTNNYTPERPDWAGGSDANPEATGNYDCREGTDTLTFTVTQPGNVEGPFTGPLTLPALIEVEVRTSDDTLVDTILFSESNPDNTPYALSNGMSIAFGKGSMEQDDTFSIDVSSKDVETADPDKSMKLEGDGTTDANFDPGLFVVDGSFDINGITIEVDESGSLNDIVKWINESAAGVTASYNVDTDGFELVQNTPGSAGQIILENDTSGFLEAVKLTGAVPVPGSTDAANAIIQDVPELSSVSSGDVIINGVSISIDITSDSVADVMARINESEAEATVNLANGFLRIKSNKVDMSLELDDNGTKFFDVFSVSVGSYAGENTQKTRGLRRGAEAIKLRFEELYEKLRDLFSAEANPLTSADAKSVRESLKSSVLTALKNTLNLETADVESKGVIDTRLGITFDFSESDEDLIEVDFDKLMDTLRRRPSRVMKFIFQEQGGQKEAGLLESIAFQFDASKRRLAKVLGVNSGLYLDVFA